MTMVRLAVGVSLLAALSLTGCSEARRALGYDKSAPDEFTVMARAPLAQPPDFTLRPPVPGAPRPQEGTMRDQAKGLLVGGKGAATTVVATTPGERVLLAKAGANQVDSSIRRQVDEETTGLLEAGDTFSDQLMFWKSKPVGEPLDAGAEAVRLKSNAQTGKPAADGQPRFYRGREEWFWGLF
jgi:hypothetical protein